MKPDQLSQIATSTGENSEPIIGLPRVTVIVTCYNYAAYIADALDFVAAQTYPDWECVIVNDASTDNSVEVVERWLAAKNTGRFRLINSEKNCGHLAAISLGLTDARGEFVALLDADDFWFPTYLQRHVEAHLNCLVTAGISSSNMLQVDGKRRLISGTFNSKRFWTTSGNDKIVQIPSNSIPIVAGEQFAWHVTSPPSVFWRRQDFGNWHWSATSGMVFRRSILNLVMPSDPARIRTCADQYLASFCHFLTGSIILEDHLGVYRRHQVNITSTLPVFGSTAFVARNASQDVQDHNIRVMLHHTVEHHKELVAIFGAREPTKLVYILSQKVLSQGKSINIPGLRTALGRWRYVQLLQRATFGRLQRLFS